MYRQRMGEVNLFRRGWDDDVANIMTDPDERCSWMAVTFTIFSSRLHFYGSIKYGKFIFVDIQCQIIQLR